MYGMPAFLHVSLGFCCPGSCTDVCVTLSIAVGEFVCTPLKRQDGSSLTLSGHLQ